MAVLTVYSDTADGSVSSTHATDYPTARSGGTLAVDSASTNTSIGQVYVAYTGYVCYESFFGFDTSSLGSGASISTAILSLYGQTDSSTTADFTIEARLKDWSTTVDTGDWVAGASLSALTSLATFATSGFSTSGYNTFTNVAMPANVNKTGTTRIICYSSRHSNGDTPSTEFVAVYSADQSGTSNDPKLVVTYTTVGIKKISTVPLDQIKKLSGMYIADAS